MCTGGAVDLRSWKRKAAGSRRSRRKPSRHSWPRMSPRTNHGATRSADWFAPILQAPNISDSLPPRARNGACGSTAQTPNSAKRVCTCFRIPKCAALYSNIETSGPMRHGRRTTPLKCCRGCCRGAFNVVGLCTIRHTARRRSTVATGQRSFGKTTRLKRSRRK